MIWTCKTALVGRESDRGIAEEATLLAALLLCTRALEELEEELELELELLMLDARSDLFDAMPSLAATLELPLREDVTLAASLSKFSSEADELLETVLDVFADFCGRAAGSCNTRILGENTARSKRRDYESCFWSWQFM